MDLNGNNAYVNRVCDAFDHAKHIAVDAVTTKKVKHMVFTIDFDNGCVPEISYDITTLFTDSEGTRK